MIETVSQKDSSMPDSLNRDTRHLGMPASRAATAPVRATGPLDEELPWVIEFRVVGTAETVQMQVHEAMIIGRSDPQQGVYPDVDLEPFGAQSHGVSRRHAALLVRNNRIVIKDLASVNGTRLNGTTLAPNHEYRLQHGDDLEVGQLRLQVHFAVLPTIEGDPTQAHAALPVLGKGEHILVVEDDSDVGSVFRIALEHAGFRVTVMDRATSALGFVSEKRPDAIVLDLMLPDMNGLDLVSYVHKQYGDQHIPMIVVSGTSGSFHINKAKDIGVAMFLPKPLSVEVLVQAVAKVVAPTTVS
jgi:CheY-like chemotaxis protein